MAERQKPNGMIERARRLKTNMTESERLLWSILRAQQFCDLSFRRQHPIAPFIVDFACVAQRLIVEIDGDYHEETLHRDQAREEFLQKRGWTVLRFQAADVEEDAESVARAIACALGREYSFQKRLATGSGMKNVRAKKPKSKTRARSPMGMDRA